MTIDRTSTEGSPRARVASETYRTSLARSIQAARRHDQLTQRLHAAKSASALIRLLFALEERTPPGIDDLSDALAEIEEAQDWPAGYLRWAVLNLVRDPAPRRQLELARRVDRLLEARGISPIEVPGLSTRPSSLGWELTTGGARRAP